MTHGWRFCPGRPGPSPRSAPGDLISVAITALAGIRWEVVIEDKTTGRSFRMSLFRAGHERRMVVEVPTAFCSTVPLLPYDDSCGDPLNLPSPWRDVHFTGVRTRQRTHVRVDKRWPRTAPDIPGGAGNEHSGVAQKTTSAATAVSDDLGKAMPDNRIKSARRTTAARYAPSGLGLFTAARQEAAV